MPFKNFKDCAILVLEDDENDALLLQRALRRDHINNPVHVVRNGEEAINYLVGADERSPGRKRSLPGFIITDLKMPLLSGLDFLKWLRSHQQFRGIPLLVLTSSTAESDVANAYGFGANSYMVKPRTLDDLEKLGRVIRDYWNQCEMPPA